MTFYTFRRKLGHSFVLLLALVFIIIVALMSWVITGPRSINWINPYIESALSSPATGYKIKIGNSEIRWEGFDNPLAVDSKNIEIINDKNAVVSYFPEISLEIYLYRLFIGKFNIRSIALLHPNVMLLQNDDGSLLLGSDDKVAPENSATNIFSALLSEDGTNPLRHLKSLSIKNANVSIKNRISGVFLQSPDASMTVTRQHGKINGTLSMPITFNNTTSELNSFFSINKKTENVNANLFYKNIPISAVRELFPGKKELEGIDLSLSGTLRIAANFHEIQSADFVIESDQGSIKNSELSETLNLQKIKIAGNLTDKLNTLNLVETKLSLIGSNSKAVTIYASGTIKKIMDDYSVDVHAETSNAPIDDLHVYWPVNLSPHSRKWVTTHISAGTVTKAEVDLHVKPGDFKLKALPEPDVAATIAIRGAAIKYLPKHPSVNDVEAIIKFTGKAMDAKVTSAKFMTGTQVTSASVRMPDMYPDDVRMFIDMNVNAPAIDVMNFLALPKLEKSQKLGLTNEITGQASGNVKLNFIAFSEHDNSETGEGDINYNILANLTNASQNRFMGKRDIENANVKLEVNNKGIKVLGDATVNKVPMHIDLNSAFGKGHQTDYAISCKLPISAMHNLDMPTLDFATGTMGVNAKFSESDTSDSSQAELDLTETAISLPEHGFSKKAGEKATLSFTTEKLASGNTLLKSLMYQATASVMSGNIEFNKQSGDIETATLDRLVYGKTDLTLLNYKKMPGSMILSATGKSFDISPYMNNKNSKKEGYNLDIKTNHLIFGDKREMQNASISASCDTICHAAAVHASLQGNAFDYEIKNGKLFATTANAGELLHTLGILDSIYGGKLALAGEYKGNTINGTLVIKDYTLKNAPLLTKILTIASLTGFLDTLGGKGISFEKLTVPYNYNGGNIVIKDAKAYGPALGLTAEGSIDTNNSTLDLKGVIIPSYTMNSLVGNVPLIGDLLTGGKGGGIIGINYTLKGNMNDPSTNVNPLSALTPGFLRGIFDIFDKPAPDIDKIAAERKKLEEKKADPGLPSTEQLKKP